MSQATASGTDGEAPPAAKLPLFTLTTMVVGSMVGAGVFSLPGRFAEETGVAGALVARGRRLFSPVELVVLASPRPARSWASSRWPPDGSACEPLPSVPRPAPLREAV
ncbi:hypothetical protein GCM10010279_18690 [Streptomyces mutabilis]|nr:hypothetical protein GCM10010279_18690 [Streptomyces mutabilis]